VRLLATEDAMGQAAFHLSSRHRGEAGGLRADSPR
jgi:hypothetical protein